MLKYAWVDIHDGKYYLYYSGDNCCGEKAHYAVMFARADYAMEPYTSIGETKGTGSSVILELDWAWLAPGHNSIVADCKGNKWIIYHVIDRKIAAKKMMRAEG